MGKSKKLLALLATLVLLCLAFAGCDNNNSSNDDPVVITVIVPVTVPITYDANGHGTAPEAATVEMGSKLTKPADPTAEGYNFEGWYKEKDCTNVWDFDNETIAAATTLYAKWTMQYIPGTFSVAADKTVHFAVGNLYWDGSAFEFETSQTAYPTSWNANHIGHFFFSKNASVAYAGTYSDSASTSDVLFTNETETTAKSDLTVNGDTGKWRTLSTGEWAYLLNTRTDANRFAKANVNGVNGLIIFPDGYNGTTSVDGIAEVNSATASHPSGSIADATWTEMESAGCVFLPAAGRYENTSFSETGSVCYWSSSPYSSYSSYAYRMFCNNNSVNASTATSPRNKGHAIRLVCDISD